MSTKKLTAQRIKTDQAFERTRENIAEFAEAGRATKLFRGAFQEMLLYASDSRLSNRLIKRFTKVLQTDPVNDLGKRTVAKGDITMLRGFNFNQHSSFDESIMVRVTYRIDRATGLITVNLPAFAPKARIAAPVNTTHFRLVASAVTIDFAKGTHEYAIHEAEWLKWDYDKIAPTEFSLQLSANNTRPILVAFGIAFDKVVNSKAYPLRTKNFNAAAIVQVDLPT